MEKKRRILFIDDEPNVLRGLQRMLHGMRHEWAMTFLSDPREALEALDREPFDVVVSDMRMPDMAGSRFLAEVMRRHPQIVRIILSGEADRELTMESLLVTHQFLAKPCDSDTVRATVSRALALRGLLDGDTPLKALVSRLEALPSLPSLYSRIVDELQSPEATVDSVAGIVAQDPAMAAKLLQLVNSAFFGLRRHVSSLPQAVGLLGLETIKALVLTAQVFSELDPDTAASLDMDGLWRHSTAVGAMARGIAGAEGCDENVQNDAMVAGLLHDIGKLILAANLPNIYRKVLPRARNDQIPIPSAERELFGAAHGETGAYLLGLWGLPEAIVEAVAFHDSPMSADTRTFGVLAAVHAANALVHELSGDAPELTGAAIDGEFLRAIGRAGRLEAWRELVRERLLDEVT